MIEGDLTVEVDGHLKSVTAPPLQALDTLWQTLRRLPISEYELKAMKWLLTSESTADLERMMAGAGVVDWTLGLSGGDQAIVRVSHGDGLTLAQRAGARYRVEQLPADERGRRPWVIRDTETGDLVTAGTSRVRPLEFAIQESADAWVRGQVNLASYRVVPGRAAR